MSYGYTDAGGAKALVIGVNRNLALTGIGRLTGFGRPARSGLEWRDEHATRPTLSPPLPGPAEQPCGLAVPRIQPELSGR